MPATKGITALKGPKKRPAKTLHTPKRSKKDDLDRAFQVDGKLATYGVHYSYNESQTNKIINRPKKHYRQQLTILVKK